MLDSILIFCLILWVAHDTGRTLSHSSGWRREMERDPNISFLKATIWGKQYLYQDSVTLSTQGRNSAQSGITEWKCRRLCCPIWVRSLRNYSWCKHVYTTGRGAFPKGASFLQLSLTLLYYSLSASTRHSRFCFWTGFKGSLPGRKPSAVRGAAAVTSWPTQPQSPFTEGASALPRDHTK